MRSYVYLIVNLSPHSERGRLLAEPKGYVGWKGDHHVSRTEQLWEQDSYDRIIHDNEVLFGNVHNVAKDRTRTGNGSEQWML